MASVPVRLEFAGGLATVFGGATTASLDVPAKEGSGVQGGDAGATTTVAAVVAAAKAHLLTGRPDLFLAPDGSGAVRPGILVLVNDTDWELCGTMDAEVKAGDTVVFISTLHGG